MREPAQSLPSELFIRPLAPLWWQRWLTARQAFLLASLVAIALGITIRATHVLAQDFPLNDGGMFYMMTLDLQRAAYHLPSVTSYNEAQIPFAYSPLGFYMVALLNDLTSLSLLELFRWFPLLVSSLLLVAFWLLAQELLPSRLTIIIAVAAFGVLPRSFIWLIMGGGLTRSLGLLFTVLTLHQLVLLYTRRRNHHAILATLCASLTVLSHLGTAPFLAISSALFFLFYGRHRHGLLSSLAMAAATIVLSAPWWGSVLLVHGLAPFRAAGATGGSILSSAVWQQLPASLLHLELGTSEPILPVIGILALIGAIASLYQGRYLLPLWWAIILCCDTRAGTTYATIPVAMLMAFSITEVVYPLLQPLHRPLALYRPHLSLGQRLRAARIARREAAPHLVMLTIAVLLSFTTGSALMHNPNLRGELPVLESLTPAERQAMRWVAATRPENRFLVITGKGWEIDRTSEWFPALTGHVSVATVQGYEWLPNDMFTLQRERYNAAQRCAHQPATCLTDWSQHYGIPFTHVYLPRLPRGECCANLRAALHEDPRYVLVYDGPGATIFAPRNREQVSYRRR